MELNLVIFIVYIILNNINTYDIRIKYFLINAFRSSVFILLVNINLLINLNLFIILINIIILIKLGCAPFHFWFINIIEELNWFRCLILSTLQKLIPLFILNYIYNYYVIIIRLILRGLFRILGGFNQNNLKKILAYSSINHLNWILISLIIRDYMLIIYFISYRIINISLIFMFDLINIKYINDLFKYKNILIFNRLNFLSLGGLPPYFGFLAKWYRIVEIINKLIILLILLLLIYSLNFIYFYVRLIYSILILNYYKIKFYNYYIINKLNIIIFLRLFSLINLILIKFWIFL